MIAASAKQIDGAESLTKEFNPELEQKCNATWITQTAAATGRAQSTVERSDDSLSTNQSSAVCHAAAFWLSWAAVPQSLATLAQKCQEDWNVLVVFQIYKKNFCQCP